MAAAKKISALRGMRDALSEEYAQRRDIEAALAQHLRQHGYAPIDVPIVEQTELYLRKYGEEYSARLYDFSFKNRRIALRPELSASILRAYVDKLQGEPLPLRLRYAGAVFRYEKPQQYRWRQFTQAGAELLGAGGARADAELLYLACSGLERLGIREYRLVIGVDMLGGFLHNLGLRFQLLNFLLRNMENLRKYGEAHVVAALQAIYPQFQAEPREALAEPATGKQLIALLREMSDAEAHQAVSEFLNSLNIRVASNRDEGEVIDRLLYKIREDQQNPKLRRALDYMARLKPLAGAPAETLARARALAAEYQLEQCALDALERTLAALADHGKLGGSVEVDLGMNRGLNYYSGMVFEIYCPSENGAEIQVCGGGRYDALINNLGGGDLPAAGFAWGIERLASALPAAVRLAQPALDVVIIPLAAADFAAAYQIARDLRERDLCVEVSIDGRGLRRGLRAAHRRGAAAAVIIGESERARGTASLRAMRSREQHIVPLSDLPNRVEDICRARG